MIRTLVVDDSFFMRKILTDILGADPAIEVVSQASSGEEAVQMAKDLTPDVITMDIVMGGTIDGVQATTHILHSQNPAPSIIIVSANTKKGSALSVDCLRAGAFAIVEKPSGEVSLDIESVAEKLVALVKKSREAHSTAPAKLPAFIDLTPRKIVIIGASTGGPPLLELICSSLDAFLPVPLLIAQHIPPHFTISLSHDLDCICSLKVKEAQHKEPLKASCINICPGGCHTGTRSLHRYTYGKCCGSLWKKCCRYPPDRNGK
jgi:two-component system, chemotaxis family, protein-glutamate methylesterase/glutaminase